MAAKPCYSCIAHVLTASWGDAKINFQVLRSFFKDVAFQVLEDLNSKYLLPDENVSLEQLMERFDLFFEKVSFGVASFASFMDLTVRKPRNESDRPDLKVSSFDK